MDLEIIETISDKPDKRIDLVLDKKTRFIYIQKVFLGDLSELYGAVKELDCPYIPKIYDVNFKDEHTYVMIEKIDMLTLDRYSKDKPLLIDDIYNVASDVAKALKDLHKIKIVDRDVKPENIFYDGKRALLFDLDIARFYGNSGHDTRLLGSHGYAAPEQYGFGESNDKSDIFGLGKVIAYMLEKGQIEDRHLAKIVDKATKIDPDDRYRDIDHLLDDLEYQDSFALPGFRKGSIITKALALVGYILLVYFAFSIRYDRYAPWSIQEIISKFEGAFWLFMIVLYCGDYRRIRTKAIKGKSLSMSIFVSILYIFLYLFIIVVIGEVILMVVG